MSLNASQMIMQHVFKIKERHAILLETKLIA